MFESRNARFEREGGKTAQPIEGCVVFRKLKNLGLSHADDKNNADAA